MHRNMNSMEYKLVNKALLSTDVEHLCDQILPGCQIAPFFPLGEKYPMNRESSSGGIYYPLIINSLFPLHDSILVFIPKSSPCLCNTEAPREFYPFPSFMSEPSRLKGNYMFLSTVSDSES